MRAVFLDRETLGTDVTLASVEALVGQLFLHDRTPPELMVERVDGFDMVIVNKVVLDGDLLRRLERPPQLVCVAATGVNNVDTDACAELGITVANCRGYGTDAVAQHTLCLMLALATRLIDYDGAVKAGDWHRSPQFCLLDYPIRELAGRTLGIVGLGTLGRRVAELGEALGMRVLVAQRPGGPDRGGREPLDSMLPKLDVLSLHCPLTAATRNLIDRRRLALMKPDALLINTARGGLVDEEALVAALRAGKLGGAGFDVLTTEPPRGGNPLLDEGIPNLIVTPHCAWASREARQRICEQLAENIRAWRDGQPVRVVV